VNIWRCRIVLLPRRTGQVTFRICCRVPTASPPMAQLQNRRSCGRFSPAITIRTKFVQIPALQACKLLILNIWLPLVDAFRTFVACPPPAVRTAFQQIQTLAVAWPGFGTLRPLARSNETHDPDTGFAVFILPRSLPIAAQVRCRCGGPRLSGFPAVFTPRRRAGFPVPAKASDPFPVRQRVLRGSDSAGRGSIRGDQMRRLQPSLPVPRCSLQPC